MHVRIYVYNVSFLCVGYSLLSDVCVCSGMYSCALVTFYAMKKPAPLIVQEMSKPTTSQGLSNPGFLDTQAILAFLIQHALM